MKDVVSKDRYRIYLDLDMNRLYLEVWDDVVDPELFAQFPEDIRKACTLLRPGFTLLADYTRVGAFFLPHIWEEAQAAVMEAGIAKSAVFWGKRLLGRMTTEESAKKASEEYARRRRSFETRAEAEAWLDSPSSAPGE